MGYPRIVKSCCCLGDNDSQPVDLNLDSCIPRPPVDTWLLAFYSKIIVKSWRFFPHLFHRHVPSFPIEIAMLLHSYIFPIKITISWPINGFIPNNMVIKLPFIPLKVARKLPFIPLWNWPFFMVSTWQPKCVSPSSQAAFSMVLHRPETLWDHGPGPGDPRRFPEPGGPAPNHPGDHDDSCWNNHVFFLAGDSTWLKEHRKCGHVYSFCVSFLQNLSRFCRDPCYLNIHVGDTSILLARLRFGVNVNGHFWMAKSFNHLP